jgi:dethiobiotin synthetase
VSVLLVSGTDTGVGKTVVTSALAALALAEGRRVAVLKPAQTGVGPTGHGDLEELRRLVGSRLGSPERLSTLELARFPDPLAPVTAAERAGRDPVTPEQVVASVAELADQHDLVLVEGAGGLLVRFSADGTLADAAVALAAPVLVVTSARLGTLNHTALTTEALVARGLRCAGLVIGSWPTEPDLAAECNLLDLPSVTGVPMLGRLPAGASALSPSEFLAAARKGFGATMFRSGFGAVERAGTGGGDPEDFEDLEYFGDLDDLEDFADPDELSLDGPDFIGRDVAQLTREPRPVAAPRRVGQDAGYAIRERWRPPSQPPAGPPSPEGA